jgi:membrane protease subunit (stomatin/prohibitin family)
VKKIATDAFNRYARGDIMGAVSVGMQGFKQLMNSGKQSGQQQQYQGPGLKAEGRKMTRGTVIQLGNVYSCFFSIQF